MRARFWQWADRLISLSALCGTAALIFIVGVTLVDVIGRYFGYPLRGAQDINQMAMVIVVFGGMAICDRLGGHIAVDVLEDSLPKRLIRIGDIVSPLLGALIFFGIAWTVWQSAALSRMLNLATNILYLPKAWFQYVVIVLSIITALGMVLKAVEAALGHKPPRFSKPSDVETEAQA